MDPPTNAATGRTRWPRRPSGRYAIAIVAPRPAPAATPSRYGSASGFRNTPWYVAPASASIAPTSAARSTRGTRICQRIASSVGESEVDTPGTCSRAPADSRTAPTPRWTGPARTPIASDTRRNATAEPAQRGRRPRARQTGTGYTRGVMREWSRRAGGEDIARKRFTRRGPQREAIESSTRTIEPVRTALILSQPGRAATVDAFWPQHTVSARTIRSGLDETTYSAESCG